MKRFLFGLILFTGTLSARIVDVWVERGHKSVYTADEPIRVHVVSKVDGYLYLYNIDPDGRVKLIFPLGEPVYIHAGVHYVLPDDFYYDVEWYPSSEPGIEYIYAVVLPYPVYEMPDDCFEPLPPYDYFYYNYDGIRFTIVFKFRPPFWFPRVYFGAWTGYYVIPRHYVYHPAPWYCYDCHHPDLFMSFYFDFCPLYEIRVYEYRYVYIPRYIRYAPRRYRIRTRWEYEKRITYDKRIRLRKIEEENKVRLRKIGIVEGKPVRELIVKDVKVEKRERVLKGARYKEKKTEFKKKRPSKHEIKYKREREIKVKEKREKKDYKKIKRENYRKREKSRNIRKSSNSTKRLKNKPRVSENRIRERRKR